jgi:hypothetical protein
VAYHDPCYLGRHNGVYDAPRNLLNILSNSVVELPRNRENSFCCGAGGAQFWKEEEEGSERISQNRYREAQEQLHGADDKVLAVSCPFCKSMLQSTAATGGETLAVRDVAELLLQGVQRSAGGKSDAEAVPATVVQPAKAETRVADSPATSIGTLTANEGAAQEPPASPSREPHAEETPVEPAPAAQPAEKRKAWTPKPKEN